MYLFDGGVHGQLVGLFLGLTEHDGPAVAAAVHLDDVAQHTGSLGPVAGDGQMLKGHRGEREEIVSLIRLPGFKLPASLRFLRCPQ